METRNPAEILNRLRSDDQDALRVLFDTHYAMVCGSIYRLLKEQSTVEDLAQEVFLRFWQKRHTIEINTSVSAYLRRMAINEALGYLRSRKAYHEEITPDTIGGEAPDGEARYLTGELEAHVERAIDTLPPKCQTVFKLSRYEELSYREIAERMDISVKTVENQMSKALKVLRQELRGYLSLFL